MTRMTRIGVLSDAHGNLAGFEACLADMGAVDRLIFTGDVLGYYFDGPAIVRRLREIDAICIAGNHDLYLRSYLGLDVGHQLVVPDAAAYRARYGPSLDLAASQLTDDEISWLTALPVDRTLRVDTTTIRLVHGSPWRPADEYVYPDHQQFERFGDLEADLVIMGHTHRPMVRTVGRVSLLNSGSCGQPRDADYRVSYAVVEVTDGFVRSDVHRVAWERDELIERCRQLAPESKLLVDLLQRGR
jgi:putative phosphoesterase